MRICLSGFVLLMAISLQAQSKFNFEGISETAAYVSTNDSLPLWFSTNNAAKLGRQSDFYLLAGGSVDYEISETSDFSGGASFYYRNEVPDEFQRHQLYLNFTNSFVSVTAGAKEIAENLQGLSASNQNILWSGNSRPLPGLKITTPKTLMLTESIGIDLGIAHYELNDNRYVEDVRLHYKHLAALIKINERNTISAKLQHFAQWGGTSPDFGALNKDFEAFFNVFIAKEASETGENGEVFNAVGNHLGSYFVEYEYTSGIGLVSLYHEHLFDDGSGTALKNFPDGVWGAYFEPSNTKWFTGLLYEFVTTKNQSGVVGQSGFDNYFNNSVYRSGWTYEGNIIGLPFMLTTPRGVLDDSKVTFVSNSLSMHHFGISGTVDQFSWKWKSTFVNNFGRLSNLFDEKLATSHHYLSTNYDFLKFGEISINLGLDTSNMSDTIFGGGLQYRYSF